MRLEAVTATNFRSSLAETWLAEAGYQRALAEILPDALAHELDAERRPPVPPGSTRHPHGARASRSPNRPGSVLVPDHRRERAAQPQPGNPGGPGPPLPGSRRREDRARRDRRLDPGLARPERGAPLERGGERLLPRPRRPLPVQERGLRQRGRAPPGARRHASAPLRPPRGPWAGGAPHRLRHGRRQREHGEPRRAAGPGLCARRGGGSDRTPPICRSDQPSAGAPARQSADHLRHVSHRGLGGRPGARRPRPHGGRRAPDRNGTGPGGASRLALVRGLAARHGACRHPPRSRAERRSARAAQVGKVGR